MLLELNEYCFYAICDYLNLTDHLVLSTVCKELQQLIAAKFCRNCNLTTLQTACWNKEKEEFQIPSFVRNLMENTKEAIACDSEEIYALKESLANLEFERVTTLTITVAKMQPDQAAILEDLLTNLFPCLLKLILPENFASTRFFYLVTIEEIEVACTPEDGIWDVIQICDLKKITFQKPLKRAKDFKLLTRCPELEELTINRATYDDVKSLIGFKHIMELTVLTITDAVNNMEFCLEDNNFYRHIDSISFHLPPSRLAKSHGIAITANMSRLRRLTFVNDDGTTLEAFCSLNSKTWSTLEEIYYLQSVKSTKQKEEQEHLLYLACLCAKLKVLDISGSAFGDQFVESVAKFLKLQQRTQKLLLRCYDTKISKNLAKKIESPYLALSFEKYYHFVPEENEIQIELRDEHRTADLLQSFRHLLESLKANTEIDECLQILQVAEKDFQGIEENLIDFENNTPNTSTSVPLSATQIITQEKLKLVRSVLKSSTMTILERFWMYQAETDDD